MASWRFERVSLALLACAAFAACGVTVPAGGLILDVDPSTVGAAGGGAVVAGAGGVAGRGGGVAGRGGVAGVGGGVAGRRGGVSGTGVGGTGVAGVGAWVAGAGGVWGGTSGTGSWPPPPSFAGRGGSFDGDGDGYDRSNDCDDRNPMINPGMMDGCCDGIDTNCDGFDGQLGTVCDCGPWEFTDHDGDGWPPIKGDCDDGNAWVFPGAGELCGDGADNDCNGLIDEANCGMGLDRDNDGYPVTRDCDDFNWSVHPFAPENCLNGIDDNCDGQIDENNFQCNSDWDSDGFPSDSDCDDGDPSVFPGAFEACFDGRDGNCDGVSDFEDPFCLVTAGDFDRDGFPAEKDCNDLDGRVFPGSAFEVCCDGVDFDCDGSDGTPGQVCACGNMGYDRDNDGYRTGASTSEPDCNDQDSSIYPGAPELCGDLRDNDCDGLVDTRDTECILIN